jgi:hypothetical protein
MDRNSYGETIEWRGQSGPITMTSTSRVVVFLSVTLGLIALASAIAIAQTLHRPVHALLLTALWSFSWAMGQRFVPQWWHQSVTLVITDRRVIWARGNDRRSIERAGISFARIHWYPDHQSGDLELVRDVPTGALRRKLTLVFRGIPHPDRVWDHIRGAQPLPAPSRDEAMAGDTMAVAFDRAADADAPFSSNDARKHTARKLHAGERLVGLFRPALSWRSVMPQSARHVGAIALGLVSAAATVESFARALPATRLVLAAGVPALSAGFVALVLALSMTTGLLFASGLSLVWTGLLSRAARDRATRYVVTDQRVVITQGDEELHLDRARIVDVVEAPDPSGAVSDVFLVLDGPKARALAMSGAFGEERDGGRAENELRPVLRRVRDPASVRRLLLVPEPTDDIDQAA